MSLEPEQRILLAEQIAREKWHRPAKLDGNGFDFGNLRISHEHCPIKPREVELAIMWLETCLPLTNVNTGRVTYGLKNDARRELGEYISDGALLVALLTTKGWKVQPLDRSLTAHTNIAQERVAPRPLEDVIWVPRKPTTSPRVRAALKPPKRPHRAPEVLSFVDVLDEFKYMVDPQDAEAVARVLVEISKFMSHDGRAGEAFRTAASFLGVQMMDESRRRELVAKHIPQWGEEHEDVILDAQIRVRDQRARARFLRKLRTPRKRSGY